MYRLCYKSRIAENVQIRPSKPFLARGEKELNKNLGKVPWHAFLPLNDFRKYKFPLVKSKSHQSNLYHIRKITDIVQLHLNELPIKKEYNKFNRDKSYKAFRYEYKQNLRKESKNISQFRDNVGKNVQKDSIDYYRTKIQKNIERNEELIKLGLINVILNKNKAEILLDTSYDSLYKHGYRALENKKTTEVSTIRKRKSFVPGVIRETLAAAAILETGRFNEFQCNFSILVIKMLILGIIQKANKTGKLYIWDPFCGSGTFMIELLQMFRGDPLRRDNMKFCFEHWPIFNPEEFEETKTEIFNKLFDYELDPAVDIRVIGSDIIMVKDYIENAGIHKYRHNYKFNRT